MNIAVEAVLTESADLVTEGFPDGTRLFMPDESSIFDQRVYLVTYWRDNSALYSPVDLATGPRTASLSAWFEWTERKLRELRQLHHAALSHERGGYC